MSLLNILRERCRQRHRTVAFPDGEPVLPDRFRGRPVIDQARCDNCGACAAVCPTAAVAAAPGATAINLGRCLFCGECAAACPRQAISFSRDYALAARARGALVTAGEAHRAEALTAEMRRVFGRSLKLRQVSAGGCNACEADTNVLTTVVFDLGRFGISFVASPRHADGLLITGPVTNNMALGLRKTWEALFESRLVIAVGACAISGGSFVGHPEQHDGAA
ncbi:MAG TPA: 4Fe-4S binding protein, partial [bacterium]|nr:4Fe-4S binding protein [bacterium]